MKNWSGLSEKERELAKHAALTHILKAVIEGGLRFDDRANNDNLQKRIDQALAEAERMRTPWFAHEYIMESCGQELQSFAADDAVDAFYPEDSEFILYI